jgi:hypothetical protein
MLTVVVLSADAKLAGQIDLWVRQTMPDKLRVEHYASLEKYKEMLEPVDPKLAAAGSAKAAPGTATVPDKNAEKDQKRFRVFAIDVDLIPSKPVQWIAELQRVTKEKGPTLVADGTPKVLIMSYETGAMRGDNFQHDSVDDLILKPVDKSLFLQKVEFLSADAGKATPNFLFRAKTAQIIEVGRDVVIDEISEFAVAVRSPGPVPEGAFASIHCDAFGTKGSRRLIGRVYESTKHPVREGEFIVRFAYFGISIEQLSTIRRFIKANQTAVRTKTWGPPAGGGSGSGSGGAAGAGAALAAAAGGAKPGLSKELIEKMALLKQRKFAVIDLNSDMLNEAKSMLESSFKGIIVRAFPSYTRLAADLVKLVPETAKVVTATAAPGKPGAPAAPERIESPFPMGKKLAVILRGKSHDLVRFEPALKKTDNVLGKLATEWVEKPSDWVGQIEKEDKESFEEFLTFVESGTSANLTFRMTDLHGRIINFEARGLLEKSGTGDGSALIRIEMTELDSEAYAKTLAATFGAAGATAKDAGQYKFEAILIDGAMLRPDPATWYERFVALLRNAKVIQGDEPPPKIFVMSDPKARAKLDDFRIKGITDFSFKPLDRRFMLLKYQAFCPQLLPVREPESPPYVPCELQAKLGREVTMDEIAEYGLSIIHPSAFREKSHMRFFSRLFGDEGEWVAGRCLACDKNTDGAESYRCQFMFFGPSEDLLQRIRRWIREDHVAKKEGKT